MTQPVPRRVPKRRSHVDSVRTTDAERAQLLAGAAADGMAIGPWLREVALKAARASVARQKRRTATGAQDAPTEP